MFSPNGFFDYCISEKCVNQPVKYEATIRMLYKYGYRTVAINQIAEIPSGPEQSKKNKKGEPRESSDLVPEPFKITPVEGCEDMKVLNRLTVKFATQDIVHKITRSGHYKEYDIIAALPLSQAASQFCAQFEADIYCFMPDMKNTIRTRNRKLFNQLVERGYHFEIPYSLGIVSSSARKSIILTSHHLHEIIKSKNIIISSGATEHFVIRNPYDVINLGFLFGLKQQQAKNAITHCGRQVYMNSISRRLGKAVMFVESQPKPQLDIDNDQPSVIEVSLDDSIILLTDDDDVDMENEQPAQKRAKQ